MAARMEEELRRDPGSAPANYWRAVAARGVGDIDGAWDAAVAAWLRATLGSATSAALRSDIDHLVTQAIIPERARTRPAREQADATEAFRAQWELIKAQWQ
jgi:phage terminase Nu1 subunit (DNA packaging protein)